MRKFGVGVVALLAAGVCASAQVNIQGNAIQIGGTPASASGVTLQTGGVDNSLQTLLNFVPSTNATGLTVTPSNPTGGEEKFELTGLVNAAHGGTGVDLSAATGVLQDNAGSIGASSALANGTTCTTQSVGDGSTKCATDAFVGLTVGSLAGTGAGSYIGGDSIACGTGASDPYTNAWAYLLRPVIGGTFRLTCRPGDQLIDTTSQYVNTSVFPTTDGHYPAGIIEDGTNDVTAYNTSTDLQNSWKRMYISDVYTQGIAGALKNYPGLSLTGWTASGTWANDTTQGSLYPDYTSSTNGNTLAYTFTCSAACVGILDYPVWTGNGGTFTVSLDGTPITDPVVGSGTTFYAAGDNGATITSSGSTGSTFTKEALWFTAASAGSHTVTVTITSATSSSNKVGVNWFGVVPTASASNPNVEAISLQHQNNANDTLSGTYNGFISAIISQAATNGVNAFFANVRDALLNTNVAIKLYVAAAGTSFAPTGWVSDTGVAYAVTGTPLAKVGGTPSQGQYAVSAGTYTFNAADAETPLNVLYTINCGANETAMFANCYADALHPNNYGHAVYASVAAAALPPALLTGNNIPQTTYPFRNYVGSYQYPSQMMTPNAFNLTAGSPSGFVPGTNWLCNVQQCSFETMTAAGGLTTVVPTVGSSTVWSLATYPSTTAPTSESQLIPLLTVSGNGILNVYTTINNIAGQVNVNSGGSDATSLTLAGSQYFYGDVPMESLSNSNAQGQADIGFAPTGTQNFRVGVTGSAVSGSNCTTIPNSFFIANYTGVGHTTGSCVPAFDIDSSNVGNFLVGLTTPSFTLNGGTAVTSQSSANTQVVTVAPGGTGTQYPGADGAWHNAGAGGMTWPSSAGITQCTGTPCTAWGTSLTVPTGALVGTSGTQTLTNKTLDGVTPATMAFVDPTSSIQTQLNAKQATGNYITALTGDVTASGPGSVAAAVVKVNGVSYGTSPSLNTVPVVTGTNAVTYEAVPNSALANSAISVNGTTCTLGSSCTLSGQTLMMTFPGASVSWAASTTYYFGGVNTGSTTSPTANQTPVQMGASSSTTLQILVYGAAFGTASNWTFTLIDETASATVCSTSGSPDTITTVFSFACAGGAVGAGHQLVLKVDTPAGLTGATRPIYATLWGQ